MAEKVDWRDKYRTLALEVEQQERQQSQQNELLHGLATQLDLALHGESAPLDRLLTSLLAQLQAGKLEAVAGLLRKTEKQVRQIDEHRARLARQLSKQIDEWALLLQGTVEEPSAALVEARQTLAAMADDLQPLPAVIDTLLSFQRQSARALDSGARGDDLAQSAELISNRMAQRLLELIQQLNVPAHQRKRARALIARLEAGPDPAQLEQCLAEVASLARVCAGGSGEDIQAYLVGLSEQLAYLRRFFDKAELADTAQLRRNNLLDQTVRHDVEEINQAVMSTHDIDQLKTAVSTQLASLMRAMDAHKRAEEQHIAELKRERQQLLGRLEEMEQKATAFRASAEQAHLQSRTDPLTGLANRLAYDQQLENELLRYRRYATPFSLCIADIDRFKRINDQYGHLVGDKVLRLIAKVMRTTLRGTDFVARFGGEEFAILLPSTRAESAYQAAEKIRQAVARSPFNFQGHPVQITLSLGVAEVTSTDSGDSLFARADSHLYTAKNSGRNRVVMQ
ncbi:MAG: GGDEF domain-containing protein [Pseudomonadota bacterium]|jgi:diguanylate cyclase|nr:GGDEF domain-containing protein [Pseudomonadota bacterium]